MQSHEQTYSVAMVPELPPQLLSRFTKRSQLDFEIDFFSSILSRQPNYLEVLRVLASNLAAKGSHRWALEIDQRIAQLCPDDPIAQYNLACSYSLNAQTARSIKALARAIELGYSEFGYLREDRDLENARKDPAFRLLLESLGIL